MDQGCPFADEAVREKKERFFGYFLAFTKKLPVVRRTAEAFDLNNVEETSDATLTPTLSRQRERGKSKVAGFPLSRE
jgi:hypothetical protein